MKPVAPPTLNTALAEPGTITAIAASKGSGADASPTSVAEVTVL